VRIVVQALVLCVAGTAVGLGANALTPRPARLGAPIVAAAEAAGAMCQLPGHISAVRRVTVEEAVPLCVACSAAFVDARSPDAYEVGHITNAFHLAPGEPADALLWQLSTFPTVVVYDGDPNCSQADRVARELIARGVKDVRVLTGAWPAWMAAGAPGTSGACPSCGATSPFSSAPRFGGAR
jgi:rhodanese-related sulfurtransferase